MTRLPTPLDPEGEPLEKFALELRSLRDRMGPGAPSVDEVSEREGIPRSTLFAALRGDRLPRREVVSALARSWGADETEWLRKRSDVETDLAIRGDLARTAFDMERHPQRELPALQPEMLNALRTAGRRRHYESGAVLLREGDRSDCVLLIETGLVKVTCAVDGDGVALQGFRGAGELVGEVGVLSQKPRSATVTAVAPVVVTTVPASKFRDLLDGSPRMSHVVTRQIIAELDWANMRMLDMNNKVYERLLRLLLGIGGRHGRALPDGSIEIFGVAQAELAGAIGVSQISLQSALMKLRKAGVLQTGYRRLRLMVPQREDG